MDTPPLPSTTPGARWARRLAGLGAATGLCLLASATPTGAAVPPANEGATEATQPAVPVAESWYRPQSPTCGTAVGCLPLSLPAIYPADTLHVGVAAGQEEARSYVALPLPASGGLKGGTLTLPIGPTSDGTVQPDAAKVVACLVTGTVKDHVEGDIGPRPGADCSVSSPAVAKTSSSGTVLSIDLAPFVAEWSDAQVGSLAVLPAATVSAPDTWHLAFSRHDRKGTGVLPLSASLLVETDATTPLPSEPAPSGGAEPPPVLPVASVPPVVPETLPQVAPEQSSPPAPSVAGGPSVVPAAQSVDTSFAYPGVFLLPPLVLLAFAWVARAFTRDLAEEQK